MHLMWNTLSWLLCIIDTLRVCLYSVYLVAEIDRSLRAMSPHLVAFFSLHSLRLASRRANFMFRAKSCTAREASILLRVQLELSLAQSRRDLRLAHCYLIRSLSKAHPALRSSALSPVHRRPLLPAHPQLPAPDPPTHPASPAAP